MTKHVAICVPCVDKPHMLFMHSLNQMYYQLGRFSIPTVQAYSQSSLIPNGRDDCIRLVEELEAQGNEIEWLMWFDSDMVFPPNTLFRLRQHDKDIVGCAYVRRTPPYDIMCKTLEHAPKEVNSGLLEVASLPTGCLLVRRQIFNELGPYPKWRTPASEEHGKNMSEDYYFCKKAREMGYSIWLDVDLTKEVGHIGEQTLFPERHAYMGADLSRLKEVA